MKEAVHQPKSGFLAGFAVVVIAIAYFFFLSTSEFKEPGVALEYDLKEFEALDKIPTNFAEESTIAVSIPDPNALSVTKDNLYVAGANKIAVYRNDGTLSKTLDVPGTPNCMAPAADGGLYVGMKDKVVVLDADGNPKAEWNEFTPRSYLTAIAVNGPDIYVADAGKRVVTRFDTNGKPQAKIGEKNLDQDVPGLEAPSPYLDLAINDEGHLWVVNPGKLGLERYEKDGTIVTSWYNPSVLKLEGFPGCCNPTHIAFTSKGELVTAEKGLVRIKMYEVTAGEFDGLVAGASLFPREQSVRDIAVDSRDRILVLDPQRSAVRVFARKESEHGQATQPA
ncbi:MAG: NHL repeat-containing protein [Candidatus Hydrogenedentes bacterium]|nr:NHL repeat-containing protein [Candidatus Hydrogenedentota bacterium]